MAYGDGKNCGHPVEVVWVCGHGDHPWNNRLTSPLDTEDVNQLLQVDCRSFTYGENNVTQP